MNLFIYLAGAETFLFHMCLARARRSRAMRDDQRLGNPKTTCAPEAVTWRHLQDAQYDPVRAVLAAVPPSGVQKYDMVGNLLRGTLEGDAAEPRSGGVRSKYDIVWQLLEAGRRSGATAKPKFDPVSARFHPGRHSTPGEARDLGCSDQSEAVGNDICIHLPA